LRVIDRDEMRLPRSPLDEDRESSNAKYASRVEMEIFLNRSALA